MSSGIQLEVVEDFDNGMECHWTEQKGILAVGEEEIVFEDDEGGEIVFQDKTNEDKHVLVGETKSCSLRLLMLLTLLLPAIIVLIASIVDRILEDQGARQQSIQSNGHVDNDSTGEDSTGGDGADADSSSTDYADFEGCERIPGTQQEISFLLELEGLTRAPFGNESDIMETAMMDAYDRVTLGCDDYWRRWMVDATLQESYPYGELFVPMLRTHWNVILSCLECNTTSLQLFADEFSSLSDDTDVDSVEAEQEEDNAMNATEASPSNRALKVDGRRKRRSTRGAVIKGSRTKGFERRVQQDDVFGVIDAADFLNEFNNDLRAASATGAIEYGYDGVAFAEFYIENGGMAKSISKGSKGKGGKSSKKG